MPAKVKAAKAAPAAPATPPPPPATPPAKEVLPPAIPEERIALLALLAAVLRAPERGVSDEAAIEQAYALYEKAKLFVGQ